MQSVGNQLAHEHPENTSLQSRAPRAARSRRAWRACRRCRSGVVGGFPRFAFGGANADFAMEASFFSVSFCGLPRAGPDFRYTNFSGGRGFPHFTYTHFSGCRHRRTLATHIFRVAVTVAVSFYLHILFGWPVFCILPTHTFDHAARPLLKKSNEIHKKSVLYIETFFALRAPFY